MAVNLTIPETASIHGVRGVRIGIAEAGIRYANRKDLTVLVLDEGTSVAGVFTKNRFCAAPVQVCQQHLDSTNGKIRALVINTGNANAGTGEPGLQHARTTCQEVAQALNIEPNAVLPFSTGVIMEPLPIQKISAGIPVALANLKDNAWFDAAHAIMTTDTLPKIYSQKIQVQQETVTVTGVSKGAGMIRPNMATMLGYLATDAGITPAVLKTMALEIANQSFNRITVDGDTSTNDSFILMATGKTAWTIDSSNHPAYAEVLAALTKAAKDLAQKIVRDAEGATKFMTIQVDSARNSAEALAVAYSIAHSPLVKTAFYASDPNLGRILAAIGYAGIDDLDTNHVALWLNEVAIAKGGMVHPDYNESKGKTVMQQAEIVVRVDLGRGQSSDTVYTCDFSHEYVSINADYRS